MLFVEIWPNTQNTTGWDISSTASGQVPGNNLIQKYRNNKKNELAVKPGSVVDSHSSGMPVTGHLKQPTRIQHGSCLRIPIWSCSEWGLPCHLRYRRRGALLPHHFNLTDLERLGRYIFCGTFHRLTPSRSYLALYPLEPGLSSIDNQKLSTATAWPARCGV